MANKMQVNNIALCYHGIVDNPKQVSAYRSYIEDFKGQIQFLQQSGYVFVTPTQYQEWYVGKKTFSSPIATVIFDDALDSIQLVTPWLIGNKIPFGVAVIGRRQRKHLPEEDFLSWETLQALCDSGFCEISSHTYNMHHTALRTEESQVIASPIMEGPCYVDNGDYVYQNNSAPLWYWDFQQIDTNSWAFPLLGTDPNTKQPITSTITLTATKDVVADRIRVWACLHNPFGSGYTMDFQILINDTLVATQTLTPTNYGYVSQWPEKEFVTFVLDNAYSFQTGEQYTVKFQTRNVGNAAFRIYSIPDVSDTFTLTSTCTEESFSPTQPWPAKPCIILANSLGSEVSENLFTEYITNDLQENNRVITNYLGAVWTAYSTGYQDTDPLQCLVLGGTYSDGVKANTTIRFLATSSFLGEVLKIKYVSTLGRSYPLLVDVYINESKVTRFAPNWNDWKWQEIDIPPYAFTAGKEYHIRFETCNQSPSGLGLARIYMDQLPLPQMVWDSKNNTWLPPTASAFLHQPLYEVVQREGTDVYPDGVTVQGSNYQWTYQNPLDGPGKAFVEFLSYAPKNAPSPKQICYPFSSYYSSVVAGKEDVHPSLYQALQAAGITSGFTVWDGKVKDYKNARQEYSSYLIPRYTILGNVNQRTTLREIQSIIEA